jgi:uncharacterized surface protein with fasciclin (FAS1) repeats
MIVATTPEPTRAAATEGGTAAPKPDDTTQARLRVSQCVYDEPQVDVYLNGKVPVDAGIPLSYVGFSTTRYEYVEPGTHTVAVVPMGQGLDQALLPPLDVQVAAGHRYTVVVLGQKGDATHKALVIDETAAYQGIGAKPTDIANIVVNNLRGVEGIDYTLSGVLAHSNVPYGGFKADIWPAKWTRGDIVSVTGAPDKVLVKEEETYFNTPGLDTLDCWGGAYPGLIGSDYDNIGGYETSALNTMDFLQGLTAESARNAGKTPSFSTFLGAVKSAGLIDLLTNGGPYLIFPPSDQAFADVPKDKLDALMADSKALADLLRRHIVEGYYPPSTLITGSPKGYFERTVANLLGEEMALYGNDPFSVNGENVGRAESVMVANGGRVFYQINKVLLPATK